MKIPGITGLKGSAACNFLKVSWQGKIVQILYSVSSFFMKTDQQPTQDPPSLSGRVEQGLSAISSSQKNQVAFSLPLELWFNIFCSLNAEELARIAPVCRQWNAVVSSDAVSLSYEIPFPSWLEDIDADVWKKNVDVKKYGLDLSKVPRVNRRDLTKALKPLSRKVEKKMGITNMVIPEGLTLKIVLEIAKDNSVPIGDIWDELLTKFEDIAAGQTRVLFFTNSIFENTRKHTSDQHERDVERIGQECGIAIQKHEIRNFMALLVLTYISSSKTPRTQLYSSQTYTRFIEKINGLSLIGGFTPSGVDANNNNGRYINIGVGASGNSEDIGT